MLIASKAQSDIQISTIVTQLGKVQNQHLKALPKNPALPVLRVTFVFHTVRPKGWQSIAHSTKSSTAGQLMWVIDKGATRTLPVYPHQSTTTT